MYVGVAMLGVSVLLAPFGGPSVPTLLLADSAPAAVAQATAGAALALLELRRQGVRPLAAASGETLAYTPAQVAPHFTRARARPRHATRCFRIVRKSVRSLCCSSSVSWSPGSPSATPPHIKQRTACQVDVINRR